MFPFPTGTATMTESSNKNRTREIGVRKKFDSNIFEVENSINFKLPRPKPPTRRSLFRLMFIAVRLEPCLRRLAFLVTSTVGQVWSCHLGPRLQNVFDCKRGRDSRTMLRKDLRSAADRQKDP